VAQSPVQQLLNIILRNGLRYATMVWLCINHLQALHLFFSALQERTSLQAIFNTVHKDASVTPLVRFAKTNWMRTANIDAKIKIVTGLEQKEKKQG